MSSLYGLWWGALVLVLLSLAALLPALLRSDGVQPAGNSDNTLRSLYQQQLQDLQRQHDAGQLNAAEWTQAQEELQQRLLAELQQRGSARAWKHWRWLPRATALALVVAVPVLAFMLYAKVGDPQAVARLAQADTLGHGIEQVRVGDMVAGLAQRLQTQPDDMPGWIMLARSYETMERYPGAAHAYQQAVQLAQAMGLAPEAQARLWADMADAQASAQSGSLGGTAGQAIAQALLLDPQQPKALALAGSAALQMEDYALARQHWQALLALLEPGADLALRVQDDLLQLELLLRPPQP